MFNLFGETKQIKYLTTIDKNFSFNPNKQTYKAFFSLQ